VCHWPGISLKEGIYYTVYLYFHYCLYYHYKYPPGLRPLPPGRTMASSPRIHATRAKTRLVGSRSPLNTVINLRGLGPTRKEKPILLKRRTRTERNSSPNRTEKRSISNPKAKCVYKRSERVYLHCMRTQNAETL
jgi:hypothetical protein